MQDVIEKIISSYKKIAVVGMSPKPIRPSHGVSQYLITHGFDVVGVNPGTTEILGKPVYPTLSDIPGDLEIVDVFRSSEFVPEIVDQAIAKGAKALWLQEGVSHPEAEEKARQAGLLVVSNRCILKEHRRLSAKS